MYRLDFSIGDYWTSGVRSKEHFQWKAKKLTSVQSEIKWGEDQPNGDGPCVAFHLWESFEESTFLTSDCAYMHRFVCEVTVLIFDLSNEDIRE